jgi:hypothetical protein
MAMTDRGHVALAERMSAGRRPVGEDKPGAERLAPTEGGSVAGRRLVGAVVVLGALVNVTAGALSLFAPTAFLALVGHRGEPLTAGAQLLAAYAGARELAVGVALVILLVLRSTRVLAGLLAVTALANALDGVGALASQRWAQAPGAFVFALAFLAAALWLSRQPRRSRAA